MSGMSGLVGNLSLRVDLSLDNAISLWPGIFLIRLIHNVYKTHRRPKYVLPSPEITAIQNTRLDREGGVDHARRKEHHLGRCLPHNHQSVQIRNERDHGLLLISE